MAAEIQRKQVQCCQNPHRNYTMGATTLATTTSEKDLGVYVDTELTFEKHQDCCKPGQQNAWTHPSLVYLPRQPVTAETVYQSCQADARVYKCSMDSYPETRPNPTRECSATSTEADTRATRQRLRGPATRTETTEPILPKPCGDMIAAYKFSHSIYKTELEPLQRPGSLTPRQEATPTSSRKNAVKRVIEPISSFTASPTDGTICVMTSPLPRV